MATIRPLLAVAALALGALAPTLAFGQAATHYLDAQVGLLTLKEDLTGFDVYDYSGVQRDSGPLAFDYTNAHDLNDSTFVGSGRVESDYGLIRLGARTEVTRPENGAISQYTESTGAFFDQLAIGGGTPGATLQARMSLDGLVPESGYPGSTVGATLFLDFFVYNESTGSWDNALAENDFQYSNEDGALRATQTATLANYDPSRTYALSGIAIVTANVARSYGSEPDATVFSEVDATHTARLTGLGFTTGPAGTFVGASGAVYPSVPEPASFLALGAGLALLRRRKKTSP